MSVMAHVQQISACNALHDLTSRLSRILLLSADRCADDIQLSQESLAEMLGVRRSSVTAAAALLRGAGAIDYRRAVIKILDREKLRAMVCECYSTIRRTIDVGFNTMPAGLIGTADLLHRCDKQLCSTNFPSAQAAYAAVC